MDLKRFDNGIRSLMNDYTDSYSRLSPDTPRLLKRLMKAARENGDDELIGYVYFLHASFDYYFTGDYSAFLRHTRQSATHLMRCKGSTEITKVYYLVSLDALGKGMYDIAYSYTVMARDISLAAGETTPAAISDEFIGYTLLRLGAYSESLKYTRRALRVILKDRSHPHYHDNVVSGYINEGYACVGLKRLNRAESVFQEAVRFMELTPEFFKSDIRFDHALLGCLIAISSGDEDLLLKRFKELLKISEGIHQIVEHIEDVNRFLEHLLAEGHLKLAGKLLDRIERMGLSFEAIHAMRLFADRKTDYCIAAGKRKALKECYQLQDEIHARMNADMKKNYRYAEDLIRLTADLQSEQERIRKEHETLIVIAETDSLTSLPNRHALNRMLEASFDRAFHNKTALGVAILDVDGLKLYNDTYGHLEGDKRLKEIGLAIRNVTEKHGLFSARYGGDEFVLIFEDFTDSDILAVAEELSSQLVLSASIGVCNDIPTDRHRSFDYFTIADTALYDVKRSRAGQRVCQRGRFSLTHFPSHVCVNGDGSL